MPVYGYPEEPTEDGAGPNAFLVVAYSGNWDGFNVLEDAEAWATAWKEENPGDHIELYRCELVANWA